MTPSTNAAEIPWATEPSTSADDNVVCPWLYLPRAGAGCGCKRYVSSSVALSSRKVTSQASLQSSSSLQGIVV